MENPQVGSLNTNSLVARKVKTNLTHNSRRCQGSTNYPIILVFSAPKELQEILS